MRSRIVEQLAARIANKALTEDVEIDFDRLDPRYGPTHGDIGWPSYPPGGWPYDFKPPWEGVGSNGHHGPPKPPPPPPGDDPPPGHPPGGNPNWLEDLLRDIMDEGEEGGEGVEQTPFVIPPHLDPTHPDWGTDPDSGSGDRWKDFIPSRENIGDAIESIPPWVWGLPFLVPFPGNPAYGVIGDPSGGPKG